MFVLLSWCCGLYVTCLDCNADFPSNRAWPVLLGIMASLLDMLLDPSTRSKKSLQKSALVRTRRALRHVSSLIVVVGLANSSRKSPATIPIAIRTLLGSTKTLPSPLAAVPLVGTAVDVLLRLKNVKDEKLKQIDPATKVHVLHIVFDPSDLVCLERHHTTLHHCCIDVQDTCSITHIRTFQLKSSRLHVLKFP